MATSSLILGSVLLLGILATAMPQDFPYPALSVVDNHISEMTKFSNDTNESILQKRQPGGVIICTDINFGGTCGYAKQPYEECIQLTSPYFHTISSLGPDQFNALVLYSDNNCGDPGAITVVYPGSSDLRQVKKVNGDGSWNDHTGSFKVRQIPGAACLGYDIDFVNTFPDTNCNWCCGKCALGGEDCCPQGAGC
ncbi:hypothetical protein F5884DRAFT_902283 [Xylogone sp. PMI_703]|nr:hypothetical protein F5884DRAFT_902283 [Xylogone sp. PMI_703]